MQLVAIAQARMGATRFPRKVVASLGGKKLLELVLDSLKKVKRINQIVLATTTNSNDDSLVLIAKAQKVECFRGSEDDVLDRYYNCAKKTNATTIIRLTCDNPFCEPELINSLIDQFLNQNVDYISTKSCKNIPAGLAVEIFTFEALEKTQKETTKQIHREHVTTYIRDRPDLFSHGQFSHPIKFDVPNLRLTIDTPSDLEFAKKLFAILGKNISISSIIELVKKRPELLEINKKIKPKPELKKYYAT